MDVTPVHAINITHRDKKVGKKRNENGLIVEVYECIDCGKESETLNLDSIESQDKDRTPTPKYDGRNTLTEIRKQLESEVLRGTTYNSIEEVFRVMKRKYMEELDPLEVPFRELISWSQQSTWKFKTKALLIYKQGHVCNRCESILVQASKLTIDHINKNRNDARLSNLQLLCLSCHREKNEGGNEVTDRDVSPFSYQGEQCVHEISCVEFVELRKTVNES